MTAPDTPCDFERPEWDKAGKVHDWRNYISEEVQVLWLALSLEVRAALARQAEDVASNEEWD